MVSGAKENASRLVEAGTLVIEQLGSDTTLEVPRAVLFLAAHGLTRSVDREIRQTRPVRPAWSGLEPIGAVAAAELDPGMVVLLGSHGNGFVRQAIVDVALSGLHSPGVVSMVTHRTIDPVPPIREQARVAITGVLANELELKRGGEIGTIARRAANGIVASADSVVHCPDLVMLALDVFESRVGPWRRDRGRDHFQRTLKDVDRRSQVLGHLRRSIDGLSAPASRDAAARLIEFYEHSLAPPRRALDQREPILALDDGSFDEPFGPN